MNPKAPFPFISIECSGHQKSFASLLREKVARIHRLKTQKAVRKINIKNVKELPAIASKSASTRKNKSQRNVHE
jgi:hypothetical protein